MRKPFIRQVVKITDEASVDKELALKIIRWWYHHLHMLEWCDIDVDYKHNHEALVQELRDTKLFNIVDIRELCYYHRVTKRMLLVSALNGFDIATEFNVYVELFDYDWRFEQYTPS